jgi:hypothetical protein
MRIGGDPVGGCRGPPIARWRWSGWAREAALIVLSGVKGAGALPQIRAALADKNLRTTALGFASSRGGRKKI